MKWKKKKVEFKEVCAEKTFFEYKFIYFFFTDNLKTLLMF